MLSQPVNPNARTAWLAAKDDARIAVTCKTAGAYPTYPAAGSNVFPITFQSATFVATPGEQELTLTPRSAEPHDVVRSLSGAFIPEGATIQVWRFQHRWYTAPVGRDVVRFILREELVIGEAARAEIIELDTDGSHIETGEMITVWDWACEFYGDADAAWGTGEHFADTPDMASDPYTSDVTYEIQRITCPGFAGCAPVS